MKKGNPVILSLVFLVTGFMLAFSYHITQKEAKNVHITDKQWKRDMDLRNELIVQEERNHDLQQELLEKQNKVLEEERKLSKEEQSFHDLAEEAEKYRIFLGKVKVKGSGVQVTLKDGEYDASAENVNSYLVHEHHVFQVVNELYAAGAMAVAINGQRLSHDSYIVCNGPVIEVDGYQHPAPFEITAIGDPDVLYSALNLTGGVKDILVSENIEFVLEKKKEIVMEPIIKS